MKVTHTVAHARQAAPLFLQLAQLEIKKLRQLPAWQRWLFAAGPVALLLVWAWEFFRVIRAQDEMMQAIHIRTIAIAAGLVLLGASLWGIPERLLGAPQLPAFLLLPIFAVTHGIVWTMSGGER